MSMRAGHCALTACLTLAFLGCAHTPTSWTPESVAPPAPAEAAIETPAPLESRAERIVPPEAASGPVALTRDGAILTGVLNNRAIEVARFGPEIGDTFIDENRAVFDPRLLASVSRGRQRRQSLGAGLTGGSASGSVPSAAKADTTSPVAQLLGQVQQLSQSLESLGLGPGPLQSTALGTSGSLGVQQYLPTGTLLFLTGEGTELDDDNAGYDSRHAWTLGLSQPLLRGSDTGANLAALRQAKNFAAQSEHAFRMAVIDVVRQIERAYWELVLAGEVLGIRQAGLGLAEEQLHREEGMHSVGKALGGDVMSARAERSARTADLADAEAALKTQSIELIRLLHPDATPRWELRFDPRDPAEVAEVRADAEESEQLALRYRPELAQARLTLANLELDVARARNGRLPQLNLVGEYEAASGGSTGSGTSGFSTSSATGEDTYTVGLEFDTALFNRAERARLLRARLEHDRGAGYIVQLEEEIAAEVRQAIVELDRQWLRLAATAEAVASREEAVRVIQGRHEVGKATHLDVLQVQRDFIQARVDDATARVRYIEALTELYAAEGTLLERRGISLAGRDGQSESAVNEVE